MRVFFTGGTGFIGRQLIAALAARGDECVVLTRNAESAPPEVRERATLIVGDPSTSGEWQEALAGCDAVINLAGASIAGRRWDAQYMQILVGSRVDSTAKVVAALAALPDYERPRTLVSASGIDYYPFAIDLPEGEDEWIEEDSAPGDSALARMCRDWEREARAAVGCGVRVVCMRTGLVLGRDGGALASMAKVFKFFVGGRLGSGAQWMSWVHEADAVGAYLHVLDNREVTGAVNLCAPEPVRNRDFVRELGRAMGRPALLPTPGFALKLAVGPLAEYLLHGRRARSALLPATGYEFAFQTLADALDDLHS